jgi:iron complex outermembrane receptor protein
MTRRTLRLTVSIAAMTAALGAVTTARAADPSTNQPTTTAATSTVAPVTITAERRVINLQAAPLAATVLNGDQLQQRGIYNVDQLQFQTPSLTVTNYGLGEDFNIRGIGKSETNVQTPSGVVVYRDGVATFAGFFTSEPYYDIANIEVLRGPQGTFAGLNASGGAVFITENDPNTHAIGGWIEGQYGNYNDGRLRFVWNIPFSDTLAIRFAASGEREDSYYHFTTPQNGGSGRRGILSARFSLLWEPTSSFKLLLKNDYNLQSFGGLFSSVLPIPPAPPYPTYASNADLFTISSNAFNIDTDTWNRTVLNAGYTFPDGIVLRSITGYQIGRAKAEYDIDGTALENNFFSVIAYEHTFSEELNAISPDKGPLRWVAGLYYQADWVHIPFGRAGFDIATPPLEILLDYTTPKTTEAVFGQLSYDITDAWNVTAGARFTHSNFELRDRTELLLFGIPGAVFGLPDEFVNTHQPDNKVTWKVALNWKLDPNNFLYAFVATGHKPGGLNTTPVPFGPGAPPIAPFKPENQTDFEVGWKPTLADGHVRGQLGGFYTRYTGYQLTFGTTAAGIGAPGQQVIRNVPGTTVTYGIEAQAQAAFGDWSFYANADWLHTRLGSTPGPCAPDQSRTTTPPPLPPAPASLSCLSGPFTTPNPAPPPATLPLFENVGGRELPYAPDWQFSIGGQYTMHLPDGSTLTPHVDYAWIDAQWASIFHGTALGTYAFRMRPINYLNAQLTWQESAYTVTLFGTNLLNGHYFYEAGRTTALGPPQSPAFGQLRYASPPLEYGIRVARTF